MRRDALNSLHLPPHQTSHAPLLEALQSELAGHRCCHRRRLFYRLLWYGLIFTSTWQGLTGITPEMAAASSIPLTFGISILATFIAAWGLAVIIGKSPSASAGG